MLVLTINQLKELEFIENTVHLVGLLLWFKRFIDAHTIFVYRPWSPFLKNL